PRRRFSFERRPVLCPRAKEYGLPRIGVPHPFIEHQHAQKIGPVFDLGKQLVRQKIEDCHAVRVDRHTRPEMQARLDRLAPRANRKIQLRIGFEKVRSKLEQCRLRNVDLQVAQKYARQPFIDQNAPVLRIVEEFGDVKSPILAFEKMGLRAASHLSNGGSGADRHRAGWDEKIRSGLNLASTKEGESYQNG